VIRSADGRSTKVFRSARGDREAVILPDGGVYRFALDAGGNVTAMHAGDREVFQRSYHRGQLTRAETKASLLRCIHDEDGVLDALLFSSPDENLKGTRWAKVDLDTAGQVSRVTDYSGLDLRLAYDDAGRLATCGKAAQGSAEDDSALSLTGFRIERNPQGNVTRLQTSAGLERTYAYETDGETIRKAVTASAGKEASVEFSRGHPTRIRQFDGGETRINYEAMDGNSRVAEIVTPNQFCLRYDYDADDRLTSVRCGNSYALQIRYSPTGQIIGVSYEPESPADTVAAVIQ
jgi:YD repeat-containing protein